MFYQHIKILAASPILALATAGAVFAQSNVDPTAPLDILKKAQEKAKTSSLKTDTIQSTLSGWGTILVIVAGVLGLALALFSSYKLYKASQDEQGRESAGGAIAGLIIGSLITVFALVVGFITTSVFN